MKIQVHKSNKNAPPERILTYLVHALQTAERRKNYRVYDATPHRRTSRTSHNGLKLIPKKHSHFSNSATLTQIITLHHHSKIEEKHSEKC